MDRASQFEIEAARRGMMTASWTNGTLTAESVLQLCARWLMRNPRFEVAFAAVIIVNAVFIGMQVEVVARLLLVDVPKEFTFISFAFTCIFTFEIAVRAAAYGLLIAFFHCPERWWHWFDLLIVVLSLSDMAFTLATGVNQNGVLRTVSSAKVVRAVRILRVVRIVRVMRNFRQLRLLIFSIFNTMRQLFWTMCLILLIMYVFSIIFTQASYEFMVFAGDNLHVEDRMALEDLFGNMGITILTLFKAITGGFDWERGYMYLSLVDDSVFPFYSYLFLVYVCFMYFAVLNVMTGSFCQSAIESAQHDQEMVLQDLRNSREKYLETLKSTFEKISGDPSVITYQALKQSAGNPDLQLYFDWLDLDIRTHQDALTLFMLLDLNDEGQLTVAEFVDGCLRLKGQAKSLDVADIKMKTDWIMKKIIKLSKFMDHHFVYQEQRERKQTMRLQRTVAAAAGVTAALITDGESTSGLCPLLNELSQRSAGGHGIVPQMTSGTSLSNTATAGTLRATPTSPQRVIRSL